MDLIHFHYLGDLDFLNVALEEVNKDSLYMNEFNAHGDFGLLSIFYGNLFSSCTFKEM